MDIGEAEKRQSSLASGTVGIPICQKVDLATITGHRDQVHHPSMFCPNSKIHPSTKALTAFMRCSSQDLCSQTRGNHIICGVKPQPKCLEHTHSHGNLNHMRHVLRFRVSLSPNSWLWLQHRASSKPQQIFRESLLCSQDAQQSRFWTLQGLPQMQSFSKSRGHAKKTQICF